MEVHNEKISPDYIRSIGCEKKFIKSNNTNHNIHKLHVASTYILWLLMLVMFIDIWHHFIGHTGHSIIVICEFILYSLFVFGPLTIKLYQDYKINECIAKYNKNKI